MPVSLRHVFTQVPVIAALGRVALESARGPKETTMPALPGPWLEVELPPRPKELVRDYLRFTGGDSSWYRGVLPPHLFPQWGFPLAAQALTALPYSLLRVMNAGCRLEVHAALPADEPLLVRARIESVDDDGRRAIVTQRIVTGTRTAPDAVVADLRAFVPLKKKAPLDSRPTASARGERVGSDGAKPRSMVPLDARELAYFRFASNAGLDFGKLTGDFNPIHWIPALARKAGFKSCILQGFATLGRSLEALNRSRFSGDPRRLRSVDVRFTRPLLLPARVGVYAGEGGGLWVGDSPGGSTYLEGTYLTRETP